VEWHDITTVTDEDVRQLGSVDIITGGFPCQAFQWLENEEDLNDTRGTLFFEIARIARILRPRYLLLENVKGLLNHAGGTLSLPSSIRWQNWGIGGNTRYLTAKISESPKTESECSLLDILEDSPDEKYFLSQEQVDKLLSKLETL
jgi:site-specific DNA-cytosine methylase